MRQKAIAELAGVTDNDFTCIKIGRKRPDEATKQRIANALNVAVVDIFDDDTAESVQASK